MSAVPLSKWSPVLAHPTKNILSRLPLSRASSPLTSADILSWQSTYVTLQNVNYVLSNDTINIAVVDLSSFPSSPGSPTYLLSFQLA